MLQLLLLSNIDCDNMPDSREETPTPNKAFHTSFGLGICNSCFGSQSKNPAPTPRTRAATRAPSTLFAQRLPLGLAVVGGCCLGKVHQPQHVIDNNTCARPSGQGIVLGACLSHVNISEYQENIDFPYRSEIQNM